MEQDNQSKTNDFVEVFGMRRSDMQRFSNQIFKKAKKEHSGKEEEKEEKKLSEEQLLVDEF
jgi:hypothetical protein